MDVVVIGTGYVGLTAACCLAGSGHNVTGVDIDKNRIKLLNQGISTIHENGIEELLKKGLSTGKLSFISSLPRPLQAEAVFIAVGTPSSPDGSADLSSVYQVCEEIRNCIEQPLIIVMKSTVPPGTGEKLVQRFFKEKPVTYISNPEFLREGQAINDWNSPDRIILGVNGNKKAAERILQLCSKNEVPALVTDTTSAETIKYASNAFLATKISFINEMANYCEAVGGNIDDVAKGIGLDKRIGPYFLQAGLGYGGSCFPKDTRALAHSGLEGGCDFRLIKATIEVNNKQRISAVHKIKQILGGLEGKEIALLGLAFKPGTDDIRDAPSLDIARLLHKAGAGLRVYDPAAMENAKSHLPKDILFTSDIYQAACDSNAMILITEWPEFIQADWEAIKKQMKEPFLIFDGRNVLVKNRLLELGFKYVGVGRRGKY